jgi:hypothetical protein
MHKTRLLRRTLLPAFSAVKNKQTKTAPTGAPNKPVLSMYLPPTFQNRLRTGRRRGNGGGGGNGRYTHKKTPVELATTMVMIAMSEENKHKKRMFDFKKQSDYTFRSATSIGTHYSSCNCLKQMKKKIDNHNHFLQATLPTHISISNPPLTRMRWQS